LKRFDQRFLAAQIADMKQTYGELYEAFEENIASHTDRYEWILIYIFAVSYKGITDCFMLEFTFCFTLLNFFRISERDLSEFREFLEVLRKENVDKIK